MTGGQAQGLGGRRKEWRRRRSPFVGTGRNELFSAFLVEAIKFSLLSGGGRGGDHKVVDALLDGGKGGPFREHLAYLADKVFFRRYMILEGVREDKFPGLDQERVGGGGKWRGDAGGSRTDRCRRALTLLAEALEAGPVCLKAVRGPSLAGRPWDEALGEFFLWLRGRKRGGGPRVFPKHFRRGRSNRRR